MDLKAVAKVGFVFNAICPFSVEGHAGSEVGEAVKVFGMVGITGGGIVGIWF